VLAGRWRNFDHAQQLEFDAALASRAKIYKFSSRGWNYHLDFERMVQINLSTGRERDVRHVEPDDASTAVATGHVSTVYSMLRCRVLLGNPYLLEGNLLKGSAMHDVCWCQNPTDSLESSAESWCMSKGHDAYYVRGLAGKHKAGLGVYNSEYIIFQPFQILPLYQVDYVLE